MTGRGGEFRVTDHRYRAAELPGDNQEKFQREGESGGRKKREGAWK